MYNVSEVNVSKSHISCTMTAPVIEFIQFSSRCAKIKTLFLKIPSKLHIIVLHL